MTAARVVRSSELYLSCIFSERLRRGSQSPRGVARVWKILTAAFIRARNCRVRYIRSSMSIAIRELRSLCLQGFAHLTDDGMLRKVTCHSNQKLGECAAGQGGRRGSVHLSEAIGRRKGLRS